MASPQLQQGYTPIANELLEALFRYRCSGAQKDILLAVIRATIGFHRESRPLGIAYLAKLTERNRKKVAANVADLIRLKVLTEIQPHTSGKCRTLALNKNFEEWVSPQRERVSQTGERFPNGREGIHHMGDTVSPNQETGYPPNGSSKKETLKETSKDSCSHDEAVRTVGGSQQSFQETTVPASVSSSARSEGSPTSPMSPTGRTDTNPVRAFQAWWAGSAHLQANLTRGAPEPARKKLFTLPETHLTNDESINWKRSDQRSERYDLSGQERG